MKKALFLLPGMMGVAALGFWAALAGERAEAPQSSARPSSALNPHGYPKTAICATISLDDPIAEAKRNIAKGDLRPFTAYGFTPGYVPGIFCPSDSYSMDSRGGTFVSDMPDACGGISFSNAAPDKMEAYNRVLGANPRFEEITGCRASTYCEEKYRKGYAAANARDPLCPGEPAILARIGQDGSTAALLDALQDFTDNSFKSRDAKTVAFAKALGRAKWANAEELLRAGADVNGRAFDTYPTKRQWLESPLGAIFNQNGDIANQLPRAKWLFENGADFSNPGAHQALTWAAFGNRVDAVAYLLSKGASPNGGISRGDQDRCAQASIESAGSACSGTPFYVALNQAQLLYTTDTPAAIAYADEQHRLARINAIALYRAGGRFSAGVGYDNLRGKPDTKVISILLAAAFREGRAKDVIDRMLSGAATARNPAEQRELIKFLRAVGTCPAIQPIVKDDYVHLCPGRAV